MRVQPTLSTRQGSELSSSTSAPSIEPHLLHVPAMSTVTELIRLPGLLVHGVFPLVHANSRLEKVLNSCSARSRPEPPGSRPNEPPPWCVSALLLPRLHDPVTVALSYVLVASSGLELGRRACRVHDLAAPGDNTAQESHMTTGRTPEVLNEITTALNRRDVDGIISSYAKDCPYRHALGRRGCVHYRQPRDHGGR